MKILKRLLALAACFVLAFSMSACGNSRPGNEVLSKLVGEAVLYGNSSAYYEGECCAEGHKILGCDVSGNSLKVYALTMFGNYGFQNEKFIKISGSGVIPAVLTFEKNGADYKLIEIKYPEDGAGYTKSIKKMFPLKYHFAALNCDSAHNELQAQERSYAEAYLKSIGRSAEIGEFADLNVVLLTDLGVSVDVSNQLIADKNLGEYPFWVGTAEYLKDGVRHVRSVSYDEDAQRIIYRTVEKESGKTVEEFIFDAVTGGKLIDSVNNQTP